MSHFKRFTSSVGTNGLEAEQQIGLGILETIRRSINALLIFGISWDLLGITKISDLYL